MEDLKLKQWSLKTYKILKVLVTKTKQKYFFECSSHQLEKQNFITKKQAKTVF